MDLPTAALADACVRLKLPVRMGPAGLRPLLPERICGPAVPAQHVGSVDVFLEALLEAPRGGILVVDNGGRLDHGCVGDLTALEARAAGAVGMVIWGLHRDSRQLLAMPFPTWSLGHVPFGPLAVGVRPAGALDRARLGDAWVGKDDWVYADEDGVVVVAAGERQRVEHMAQEIVATEQDQADRVARGQRLADQLDLRGFVTQRTKNPQHTFREHLRKRGGAIEE